MKIITPDSPEYQLTPEEEAAIGQQESSGIVTPDSPEYQLTPEEEIEAYKLEGGGIMSGLERGARRVKQTLAGAGAALGDALIDDEGPFDTSPVGRWLKSQTERDKKEVEEQQQAIEELPTHPAMQKAVQAANASDDYTGAVKSFLSEVWDSPDTGGMLIDTAAELAPQALTMLVGTKGVNNLLPTFMKGMQRHVPAMAGGGFLNSVANTYGSNVAEGLRQGLDYDQAEARASIQSLTQGGVDALTSAVVPWKIGPSQFINIPAQTVIQMAGGATGEISKNAVVGDESQKGDVVAEALLEALGLPGDILASTVQKSSEPSGQPVPPEPTQEDEGGVSLADVRLPEADAGLGSAEINQPSYEAQSHIDQVLTDPEKTKRQIDKMTGTGPTAGLLSSPADMGHAPIPAEGRLLSESYSEKQSPETMTGGFAGQNDGASGRVEDQPSPEKPETLEAQLKAFEEGRKPAVLLTPGESVPSLPENAQIAQVPGRGLLIYKDPAVLELAMNDRMGEALGYGISEKPTSDQVVTARDETGQVVQDVLTDGRPEVVEAAERVAGPEGAVETRPAVEALQERHSSTDTETVTSEQTQKNDENKSATAVDGHSIPKEQPEHKVSAAKAEQSVKEEQDALQANTHENQDKNLEIGAKKSKTFDAFKSWANGFFGKDNAQALLRSGDLERAWQKVGKPDPATKQSIDTAANEAATSTQNDTPEPTEAQKKAGNYKVGKTSLHGLDISIENPKDSERSGTDSNGKSWSVTMKHHYGYIRGTEGKDKDHIDVFLGPDSENADLPVFVVDQVDPDTKEFDEHKALMGFKNKLLARQGYQQNYQKGWKGVGAINQMSLDEFKAWLDSGDTKSPISYKEKKRLIPKRKTIEVNTSNAPGAPKEDSNKKSGKATSQRINTGKRSNARNNEKGDQETVSQTRKIEDLGEKIGGARKDVSVKTGSSSSRKLDNKPAWRKRYVAVENLIDDRNEWEVIDTRTGRALRGNGRRSLVFKTQEEAESTLPIVAVAEKHSVRSDGEGGFTIWRKVNNRKSVRVSMESFDSREKAMAHMAKNAESILETKLSFGEEVLPTPEKVYRSGIDRRKGNVKGEDFMGTFGFRGVEFGKWNNQDERQEVMNHAYDSLLDLADILNVPPIALSLNGDLALAFGARGQGLSGAKAHYEHDYGVINLTKMNGAGSLGHEWFHAFDHYISRLDGAASSEKVKNTKGDLVYKSPKRGAGMASHGFLYKSNARKEVREALTSLIEMMYKKAETYVEDTHKAEDFVGKARDELSQRLQSIRAGLSEQLNPEYWKRKNKPATSEQLARFDELSESLINGESLELEARENKGGKSRISTYRMSNDVLDEMGDIYKAVRGRGGFNAQKTGVIDNLRRYISHYQARIQMLKDAESSTEKTKKVPTEFHMQAKAADQAKSGEYWSSPHEMAARAFAAYIEDKLATKESNNDFLAYHAHGAVFVPVYPEGFFRPYPEGVEREAINNEFDKLFSIIETQETDKGIAIFSKKGPDLFAPETAEAESFRKKLKSWSRLQGSARNSGKPLIVGSTPAVMQAFGVPDLKIQIDKPTLIKVNREAHDSGKAHGITIDQLSQLPELLADPVAIFSSKSKGMVVLTELLAEGDKPVMVAVHVGKRVGRHSINDISSMYGRPAKQYENWVKDGRLRYYSKEKSPGWKLPVPLQLRVGRASSTQSFSDEPSKKMTNRLQSPYVSASSAGSSKRIYTPEDVVNWAKDEKPLVFSQDDSKKSDGKQEDGGISAGQLSDVVDNIVEQFGHKPPVRVIERVSEVLPDTAKDDFATGFVRDGRIHLVRPNLPDASTAVQTLWHELLHYGLRRFLTKDQYVNEMLELYSRDAWVKQYANRWRLGKEGQALRKKGHDGDYIKARGVDEALAELGETVGGTETGFKKTGSVAKAIRAVVRWLSKAAEKLGFNDAAAWIRGLTSEEARLYVHSIYGKLKSDAPATVDDWAFTSDPAFMISLKKKAKSSVTAKQGQLEKRNQAIRERNKTLIDKAKATLQRNLTSKGHLPQSVFDAKISRDSSMGAVEIDVSQLVSGLEQAVKKAYGKPINKLSEDQLSELNDAMGSKFDSIQDMGLDAGVVEALTEMRQYIDIQSTEYAQVLNEDAQRLLEEDKTEGAAAKAGLLETIAGNIGQYVHRSYKAFDDPDWYKKVPSEVLNSARDYLGRSGVKNPDQMIETILKEGTAADSMEAFIRESKLGAKDLSVMKRRKQIAPEIRNLLGEYKDPRINFTKSATKMSRLLFNDRFLRQVEEVGKGVFLFTDKNRPVGAYKKLASDSSEVYAPLNGYYTFPEVEQGFKDALGKENLPDWYRAIVKVNGLVKYGKTVLSPTTAMRNWMSAYFFTVANGHFNLKHTAKSLKSMKAYFKNQGGQVAYLRKLKELGVVYDTPYAGEMMRLLDDANIEDKYIKNNDTVKNIFDKLTKFYQFGDDYWKIIGFENEVAILMNKKGLSRSEAEPLAAKRIRETYPTYSLVSRAVQKLRRFPLAGTFVSFPAEIIRTSFYILKYLKQDLADPEMKSVALRRIAGLAAASGFAFAAQEVAKSMLGMDDDEEEALRVIAPKWSKNSNILPLDRDEKGNIRYIDLSFLDPYNYFKRPITALMRDEPTDDMIIEAGRELLEPFLGEDITFGAVAEVWHNKRELGGKVYNEAGSPVEQTKEIVDHLRKSLQPGVMSNIENMVKALTDHKSRGGRVRTVPDEIAANLGFRISTIDPATSLFYRAYELKDVKRNASSILNRVASDPNDVNDEELLAAYEKANKARDKGYRDMLKLIAAARASGLNNLQIAKILRANNISKSDVRSLIAGKIPKWRATKSFLRNAIKKAEAIYDAEDREKFVKRQQFIMAQ